MHVHESEFKGVPPFVNINGKQVFNPELYHLEIDPTQIINHYFITYCISEITRTFELTVNVRDALHVVQIKNNHGIHFNVYENIDAVLIKEITRELVSYEFTLPYSDYPKTCMDFLIYHKYFKEFGHLLHKVDTFKKVFVDILYPWEGIIRYFIKKKILKAKEEGIPYACS